MRKLCSGTGRPCVLEGGSAAWPASQLWGRPGCLLRKCAQSVAGNAVQVSHPAFSFSWASMQSLHLNSTLRQYIEYLRSSLPFTQRYPLYLHQWPVPLHCEALLADLRM